MDRRIFYRVWTQGLSAAQAAAEESVNVEAVYVAKSRVLNKLAEVIRELTDDHSFFAMVR
jgi:DNA-directed RNA polymerase specialized sigma24 family protein